MSRPKTTDKRKKYDALMKELSSIDKSYVTVGVHEDAGSYPGGIPVAHVAAIHEFGTHNAGVNRDVVIPRRPVVRPSVDNNLAKIYRIQDLEFSKIMAGKQSVEEALNRIGFFLKTQMEKRIQHSNSWATPNAESVITQKKKGGAIRGATPLIYSGLLARSYSWKTVVQSGRKAGKK